MAGYDLTRPPSCSLGTADPRRSKGALASRACLRDTVAARNGFQALICPQLILEPDKLAQLHYRVLGVGFILPREICPVMGAAAFLSGECTMGDQEGDGVDTAKLVELAPGFQPGLAFSGFEQFDRAPKSGRGPLNSAFTGGDLADGLRFVWRERGFSR